MGGRLAQSGSVLEETESEAETKKQESQKTEKDRVIQKDQDP